MEYQPLMNKNYVQKGFTEERIFKNSLEGIANIYCKKSSNKDDMYKHIDFYLSNGWSVDVKSSNKVCNGEHYIWLELLNVNGNKGWIDGNATHIAFSLGDRYIFFERNHLRNFIKDKISIGEWKYKQGTIYTYIIYRRFNKLDKIVLVPLKDLLILPHTFMIRDETLTL